MSDAEANPKTPRVARKPSRRIASLLLAAAGLVLALYLLAEAGPGEVIGAAVAAGWTIIAIGLYRFLPLGMDAAAWGLLAPPGRRPRPLPIFMARWIGESVNTLLPVAQIGGDVLRAGLMAPLLRPNDPKAAGRLAGATVTVDFILGLMTQAVFTLAGLAILAAGWGGRDASAAAASTVVSLPIAAVVAGVLIAAALWALRGGAATSVMRALAPVTPRRALANVTGAAVGLDEQISRIFVNTRALTASFLIKTAAWFARAAEIYIICLTIGAPVSPAEAIVLESIAMAARSAAFAIPGAIGAQEGGLLLAGSLIGMAEPTALTIALIKRAREIVTGLPGLAVWTIWERRRS